MKKRFLIAVSVILVAAAALSMSACIFWGMGSSPDLATDAPFAQQVLDYIDTYYYEDIDWDVFQYNLGAAIAGSVDKFTGLTVTSPVNASSSQLGVTLSSNRYNEHYVSRVVPGSNAETAVPYQVFEYKDGQIVKMYGAAAAEENMGTVGLKRGDEIVAIKTSEDSEQWTRVQNLAQSTLNELVSALDTVDMHVYRYSYDENGEREIAYQLYFSVEKKVFHTPTARYIDGNDIGLGDGFGYISLTEFGDTAVDDFAAAAQAFVDDPSSPTMLLLDLRGNGGGSSTILGFIASYFVSDGSDKAPMARYVYNNGGRQAEAWFYTSRTVESSKESGKTLTSFNFYEVVEGFEVAILTDGGTASSSELLTWTIDFYSPSGAPTVGTTTYGKGVAQTVISLAGGNYELYITNGKYYVPLDVGGETAWETSIHEVGISPAPVNVVETTEVRDYSQDLVILRAASVLASN